MGPGSREARGVASPEVRALHLVHGSPGRGDHLDAHHRAHRELFRLLVSRHTSATVTSSSGSSNRGSTPAHAVGGPARDEPQAHPAGPRPNAQGTGDHVSARTPTLRAKAADALGHLFGGGRSACVMTQTAKAVPSRAIGTTAVIDTPPPGRWRPPPPKVRSAA